MVLIKQHVLAYSEAIIRFTNVSNRKLITMRALWQILRSHHPGLVKHIGNKPAHSNCTESVVTSPALTDRATPVTCTP